MGILRFLGWITVPYIMILFRWRQLGKVSKILAIPWALVALLFAIGVLTSEGQDNNPNMATPASSTSVTSQTNINEGANNQTSEKQNQDETAAIKAFAAERGISNFDLAKEAYKAQKEREYIIANAREYDYADLLKSAEGTLKGKPIHFSGEITFIRETTNLGGNITGTALLVKTNSGDILGAYYRNRTLECQKGNIIDVFGKINGFTKMTNGFGGETEVPDIEIVEYDCK
ncbi:hypothetical protein ABE38_01455 [Brevibacillus agri]|nr:hypothetical protein [Brevibacillus agri]